MPRAHKVMITSSGIQNSLSKYEPLQALCEYIWNGFDAQASIINISMSPNEMGVAATLSISDNGTGIDRNNLESKFKPIYESEKTYQYDPNIKHSHTKGKNGVGRLTFFKFAESAEWETIYEHDGNHYRYLIQMNRATLNNYNPTEETTTVDDTGTIVRFTNIVSSDICEEAITSYVSHEFCWFLELHKEDGFQIVFNGKPINYTSMIADSGEEIYNYNQDMSFKVRYVIWYSKLSEFSKYYFITSNGSELGKENTTLNNKGDKFYHSVYIQSNLFDDFSIKEQKVKGEQLDALGRYSKKSEPFKYIMEKVDELLYNKRRPYLRKQVSDIVDKLDVAAAFPNMSKNNEFDKFRLSQIADIAGCLYVAEPKLFTSMNKEQKKTFLRMLDLIMQSGEINSFFEILNEIIDLDTAERNDLAEILKYTTLSNVTRTISLLKERYEVVQDLKALVFRKELKANEVNHVQKAIEAHYWLFGEQYNLVTAEEPDFEEALRRYLKYLHKEYEDTTIDHPDKHKQMDIFAVRRDIGHDTIDNIVVELKHPDIGLGETQLSQVKKYMSVILKVDQFNASNMTWKFYLVGNKYNDYIRREMENSRSHGERSLVYSVDKCKIYVMTWSEVFSSFEIRYNYLYEKLNLQKEKLQKEFASVNEVMDDIKHSTAKMPEEMTLSPAIT